jgi:hypothetical protein
MKRQVEVAVAVVEAAVAVVAEGCRRCCYRQMQHHRKSAHHKLPAILPKRGLPTLLRGIFRL